VSHGLGPRISYPPLPVHRNDRAILALSDYLFLMDCHISMKYGQPGSRKGSPKPPWKHRPPLETERPCRHHFSQAHCSFTVTNHHIDPFHTAPRYRYHFLLVLFSSAPQQEGQVATWSEIVLVGCVPPVHEFSWVLGSPVTVRTNVLLDGGPTSHLQCCLKSPSILLGSERPLVGRTPPSSSGLCPYNPKLLRK
jgi:hypothetical protein